MIVVGKLTFDISSADEFLCMYVDVYASLQRVNAVIYMSMT